MQIIPMGLITRSSTLLRMLPFIQSLEGETKTQIKNSQRLEVFKSATIEDIDRIDGFDIEGIYTTKKSYRI